MLALYYFFALFFSFFIILSIPFFVLWQFCYLFYSWLWLLTPHKQYMKLSVTSTSVHILWSLNWITKYVESKVQSWIKFSRLFFSRFFICNGILNIFGSNCYKNVFIKAAQLNKKQMRIGNKYFRQLFDLFCIKNNRRNDCSLMLFKWEIGLTSIVGSLWNFYCTAKVLSFEVKANSCPMSRQIEFSSHKMQTLNME